MTIRFGELAEKVRVKLMEDWVEIAGWAWDVHQLRLMSLLQELSADGRY